MVRAMAAPRLPLPRRASFSGPEGRAALRPDPSVKLKELRKRLSGKQASYLPNTYAKAFANGLDAPAAADRTSAEAFAPLPEDLRVALGERSFATARREGYAFVVTPSVEAARAVPLDALAVAEAMARHVHASTLAIVAAARSLDDAVRVASLAGRLGTGSIGGYPNDVHFTPDGRYAHFDEKVATELRHLVCAADDAAYAKALTTARVLRDALGEPAPFDPNDHDVANAERRRTYARALFAFAFPDEPLAEEELAALLAAGHPPHIQLLASLATLTSAQTIVQARSAPHCAPYVHELADALPENDAITLLEAMLPELLKKPRYQPLLKTPPRELMHALARLPGPRVSEILARYAKDPVVGVTVLEIFRTQPERAAALEAATSGTKLEGIAARVVGARDESAVPIADDDAYPELLRARPWRAKMKKKKSVVITNLPVLGEEHAFVDTALLPRSVELTAPLLEGAVRDAWWDGARATKYFIASPEVEHERKRYALSHEDFAAAFTLANGSTFGAVLDAVARLGLDAVPGLVGDWARHLDYEGGEDRFVAATALVAPRMAVPLACVAMKKAWRDRALAWFRQHADVVVPGLLPGALGDDRTLRSACESVLLHLRDRDHAETIRSAARALGDDASSGIEVLLAHDAIRAPAKVPARPPFLRVEALPALRTTSGTRLPDDARDAWLDLLSLGRGAELHPGALVVAADPSLDRTSLATFARELFEQWVLGDAPGRHEWMAYASVVTPSDEGTTRVGAFAREQARKNAAKAERACQVLAAIGSDRALTVLELVATTTRYGALATSATALREQVAHERGWSVQELADRTLPDGGLDAHGRCSLVRGASSLEVRLDPVALAVRVRAEAEGEWKSAPPRTNTKTTSTKTSAKKTSKNTSPKERSASPLDEREEELALLREDFAQSKRDVELAVDVARRRLELALRDERGWTKDDFVRFVLEHPVAGALARGLVWETFVGGLDAPIDRPSRDIDAQGSKDATEETTFRIAEDGSLADLHDAPFVLPEVVQVRLAHPARGIDRAWAERLADYDLTQPFEQLGRAVDGALAEVARIATGLEASPRRLLGLLEARGWHRVVRGSATLWSRAFRRADGGTIEVVWRFEPEVFLVDIANVARVTAEPLVARSDGELARLLSPVAVFELLRDVEAVRA